MDAGRDTIEKPDVMDLLAAHLPLSLLVDLALVPHLRSQDVYEWEAGDATWLPAGSR